MPLLLENLKITPVLETPGGKFETPIILHNSSLNYINSYVLFPYLSKSIRFKLQLCMPVLAFSPEDLGPPIAKGLLVF